MPRLLALCSLLVMTPVMAEARSLWAEAPMRGASVAQRFLPGGASVVTTPAAQVCLVSQRIDIAASEYRDATGETVDFAEVVRSPATVIQAIASVDGAVSFRVQLKFSPQPGAPLYLDLPSGPRDISGLIEPSGDSLLIAGDLAGDLAEAFAQGESPRLRSLSRDTGRSVADRLSAPDLAALAACATTLAPAGPQAGEPAAADAPAPAPARLVRAVFTAEQGPEHIATPGQLQACGMADRPATLYLGRLQGVTGFVSHTDKVFLSYAADGAIERVYIPGIFDADLRGPAQASLRVSRAADGNVPAAPNQVSGCIGAETMAVCHTDLGGGAHALTACPDDGIPDLFSSREYDPGPVPTGDRPLLSTQLPPVLSRLGPPAGGGGGTPPGTVTTSRPPPPPGDPRNPGPPVVTEDRVLSMDSSTPMHGGHDTPPQSPPPPSVVPLPAGLWLMLTGLGALGALAGTRRNRRA